MPISRVMIRIHLPRRDSSGPWPCARPREVARACSRCVPAVSPPSIWCAHEGLTCGAILSGHPCLGRGVTPQSPGVRGEQVRGISGRIGNAGRNEHGYPCVMVQVRNKASPAIRRPATPRQAGARRGPLDQRLVPDLFKALGDPVRGRLLACVAKCGRACSVGEVAECCDLDLSTVSRHLMTLARAGVMESSKRGTSVLYAVRYEYLATTLHALAAAFEACRPPDARDRGAGGCHGRC